MTAPKPEFDIEELERVMVGGKWHQRSALGHGIYTSVEQGEADVAARPFRAPFTDH
jgi:hypothetical protein